MEFNNENAKTFKIFDKIDLSDLPEELNITQVNQKLIDSELTQANVIANIPNRFANTRFKDIADSALALRVKKFCLKPKTDDVFLIFGQVGLGKTSLMAAAIHERRLNNLDCGLYFSNRFLCQKLRSCKSFTAKESEEDFYKRLSTVSFLCLDEVGAASVPAEEREFLTTIICARYDNLLPTFIVSNLSPFNFRCLIANYTVSERLDTNQQNEISKRLDSENAVLNRLKSVSTAAVLTGVSYRQQRG